MSDSRLYMWFMYVIGPRACGKAMEAGFRAQYNAESQETTIVINAFSEEAAREIAGRFGHIVDLLRVKEIKESA